MDFIERLFGIAPDGGSGSLEWLLFLIPIAGIAWLAAARRRPGRRADDPVGPPPPDEPPG